MISNNSTECVRVSTRITEALRRIRPREGSPGRNSVQVQVRRLCSVPPLVVGDSAEFVDFAVIEASSAVSL